MGNVTLLRWWFVSYSIGSDTNELDSFLSLLPSFSSNSVSSFSYLKLINWYSIRDKNCFTSWELTSISECIETLINNIEFKKTKNYLNNTNNYRISTNNYRMRLKNWMKNSVITKIPYYNYKIQYLVKFVEFVNGTKQKQLWIKRFMKEGIMVYICLMTAFSCLVYKYSMIGDIYVLKGVR